MNANLYTEAIARQFQVDEIDVLRVINQFFNRTAARDTDLTMLLYYLAKEFRVFGWDIIGATRILAALLSMGFLPEDIETQIKGMNRVGKAMMTKRFRDMARELESPP